MAISNEAILSEIQSSKGQDTQLKKIIKQYLEKKVMSKEELIKYGFSAEEVDGVVSELNAKEVSPILPSPSPGILRMPVMISSSNLKSPMSDIPKGVLSPNEDVLLSEQLRKSLAEKSGTNAALSVNEEASDSEPEEVDDFCVISPKSFKSMQK